MPTGRMASQPGPIKLLQLVPVADLFRTSSTLLVDQADSRVDLEVLQPLLSRCNPISSVSNQKQQHGVPREGTCFAPDRQMLPAVLQPTLLLALRLLHGKLLKQLLLRPLLLELLMHRQPKLLHRLRPKQLLLKPLLLKQLLHRQLRLQLLKLRLPRQQLPKPGHSPSGTTGCRRTTLVDLVIWDEAPMMHKHIFEYLDRALHDVTRVDALLGGKVVNLRGDFRQISVVIPKGSRAQIAAASLKRARFWLHIQKMELKINRPSGLLSGDLDVLNSEIDDVTVTCFSNLAGSQQIIILASNHASVTD
ncbi:TPA: hypothetical protein ACH3X2_14268 [Trebouxia sp. C0005]